MDDRKWFQKLFGFCPGCGRWLRFDIKRRRQNTAYVDEESNYITVCSDCFEEVEAHWAELWEEYYASRL